MIGFLHPWMLAGLAAASIPILLHLLQRREPPTVVFPAVRYLIAATQQHHRRLKLQNWLLLILRTALILLIVLAAAGPTVPARGAPGHAPSALVVVVDNSASSGAVVNGAPKLARLQSVARAVLARATPDDAIWLVTADGVARRGDASELRGLVAALEPSPRRLDLGDALRSADQLLQSVGPPGEIVLLSDLQATAVSPAEISAPLLVARAGAAGVRNVGIASLSTGSQPWSSDGGRLVLTLVGDSGPPTALSARLGERPGRQGLASAGGTVALALPGAPGGWWPVTAELDPDELRADDRRLGLVRIAPVSRARCDAGGRYVVAACDVLVANRRLARGDELVVGRLGPGRSVVEPPADPAELGALNRALERRGVGWTYGSLVTGGEITDSAPVLGRERVTRRYALEPGASGRTGVVARVNRQPWIVRSGDVVILASRLEPEWTTLPVSAGFMPFMDHLLNRVARGEVSLVDAAPGDPAPLPDRVTEVVRGPDRWRAEGGAPFRPVSTGVHYLLAGADTVGGLAVNLDPRESRLAPIDERQLAELWPGARMVDAADAADTVFQAAARGDLRSPLLWFALIVALTELGLASAWRRSA
ncbi:MAG TPA: BatA and WFA domain-containing protein [Gemmatimonadales bacterium]|nr:BatA and WFA domain-containing protein [Gemmatimonadales bacterium]